MRIREHDMDAIFVEATGGNIELRIGDQGPRYARLTPAEARSVAYALLLNSETASAQPKGESYYMPWKDPTPA